MLQLNSIDAQTLNQAKLDGVFSLYKEYLEKSPAYSKQPYEWYYVTDDRYGPEGWLALCCITEDRFIENSMHLSVFEVAKPIQRLGIGSEVMSFLIDTAIKFNYKSFTLQIRNPELYNFYHRFGFERECLNSINFLLLGV